MLKVGDHYRFEHFEDDEGDDIEIGDVVIIVEVENGSLIHAKILRTQDIVSFWMGSMYQEWLVPYEPEQNLNLPDWF